MVISKIGLKIVFSGVKLRSGTQFHYKIPTATLSWVKGLKCVQKNQVTDQKGSYEYKNVAKNYFNCFGPFWRFFLGPFLGQNAPKITQIRKKLKFCLKKSNNGSKEWIWVWKCLKSYFKFLGPLWLFLGAFWVKMPPKWLK